MPDFFPDAEPALYYYIDPNQFDSDEGAFHPSVDCKYYDENEAILAAKKLVDLFKHNVRVDGIVDTQDMDMRYVYHYFMVTNGVNGNRNGKY